MSTTFQVEKGDLLFEASFEGPDFAFFQDTAGLLRHLFQRLERYGLRLNDLRVERGTGSVAEFHVLCYLFNYWMTIRVRVDRAEVMCANLPKEDVETLKAVILDVLTAIRDHRPNLTYRAFGLAVGLHGRPEGMASKDYLSRFVSSVPKNLGPLTTNGVVFYFGPDAERLLSALTVDASALVSNGVYLRLQGTWDGKRVAPEALPDLADQFLRQSVECLGLRLSQ